MGHHTCATHETHKLDCSEFEKLRARAGDRCEVCGDDTPGLHIDHDRRIHAIHAVRGLVCAKCNNFMSYFDREVKHSAAAEKYEVNAWYRGGSFVLAAGQHPDWWRASKLEQALCLQIDLRPKRKSDLPLVDEMQRWVVAFRGVCEIERLSAPEVLWLYAYLSGLRHREGSILGTPSGESLHAGYLHWRARPSGVAALLRSSRCPYCGVPEGKPCIAGRAKEPIETVHQRRHWIAEARYDRAICS